MPNIRALSGFRYRTELFQMREFKRTSQLRDWKCFLTNRLRLGEHKKKTKIKTKNER